MLAERMILLDNDRKTVENPLGSMQVSAVSKQKKKAFPRPDCHYCGDCHFHRDCPFKKKTCQDCNVIGHNKGYCDSAKSFDNWARNRPGRKPSTAIANTKQVFSANHQKSPSRKFVKSKINDIEIKLKHDSGSDWNLISKANWENIGSPRLTPVEIAAISASGHPIKSLGMFSAVIEVKNRLAISDVYVSAEGQNLFGNPAMEALDLWDSPISMVVSSVTDNQSQLAVKVKEKFPSLFSSSLGLCTGFKASLTFKENAKPPFIRARPVPHGALDKVEGALRQLQNEEVISPISYALAAAPIVAVQKKDGSIRVTADFSTGLNKALEDYKYPIPTPESMFASLSGNVIFTTLDLSNAFNQVPVDDEAKKYMAINTHLGLFQVNEAGLRLNHGKCVFGQPSIRFLGKIIDAKGIRPDPAKLQTIRDLPRPDNVSQLRAFLGAINWFHSASEGPPRTTGRDALQKRHL
ncbi:uncharacterized protein K02A2.6-like [Photinus pyralis]|uniref:uncharacterized protein K02A2.6-like n=1 Tax=Photinus pyralis TaxID=7054 RepID=UPI00126746E9|nr:uncharacterized protein K02A2.6-like [Photinus pyralis]